MPSWRNPLNSMLAAGQQADRGPDREQRREAQPEADHRDGRPATEEERDDRHGGAQGERDHRPDRGTPRRAELIGIEAQFLTDQHVERGLRVLHDPVGDRRSLVPGEALGSIRGRQLGLFLLGHRRHLGAFELDLALEQLALALHADVFAGRHAERAREQPGDAGEEDEPRVCGRRAGHAHDQRQVADESVAHAEDDRAERAGSGIRPVPLLEPPDIRGRRRASGDRDAVAPDRRGRLDLEPVPDPRVLALVSGDRGDLGRRLLGVVCRFLVALERPDQVRDGARPEQAGDQHDQPDPWPGAVGRRDGRAELGQLVRPDVGVAALVRRDPAERVGTRLVLFDLRQRVVQHDRVAFQLEILEARREVDGRHAAHRTRERDRATPARPRRRDGYRTAGSRGP